MPRRLGALVLGLALAFAACGDGENTGAMETTSPSPSPTPCSVTNGGVERRSTDNRPETAPLTDVRYSAEGCPRIVLEFSDHVPDHVVEYAEPPFSQCGSGEPVDTSAWGASAYLMIRLEPSTTADLSQEQAPQTYDGPRDISVGGDVLKHMQIICDFEAQLEWLVGLDGRQDFSVVTLTDPPRVVVDVSES